MPISMTMTMRQFCSDKARSKLNKSFDFNEKPRMSMEPNRFNKKIEIRVDGAMSGLQQVARSASRNPANVFNSYAIIGSTTNTAPKDSSPMVTLPNDEDD